MEGARPVRAPRGTTLTAHSWATEAPMRMLMNNLDPENAERPDDLVVYGGTGRAARDWRSFDAMVRTLTNLEADETMLVQSGRRVGVMRTHERARGVSMANSNMAGTWVPRTRSAPTTWWSTAAPAGRPGTGAPSMPWSAP